MKLMTYMMQYLKWILLGNKKKKTSETGNIYQERIESLEKDVQDLQKNVEDLGVCVEHLAAAITNLLYQITAATHESNSDDSHDYLKKDDDPDGSGWLH